MAISRTFWPHVFGGDDWWMFLIVLLVAPVFLLVLFIMFEVGLFFLCRHLNARHGA
jgi:hypothetical protein